MGFRQFTTHEYERLRTQRNWWTRPEAPDSNADIVQKFLLGAGVESQDPIRQRVQCQIHVVVYTDQNPPVWLAT
jgi:hypothetical protein